MSGNEVLLLLGGFVLGAVAALIIRFLLKNRADNGSISVSGAQCMGSDQLQINGSFTTLDGNSLIKLFTAINADASTNPQSNGAMEHDPPETGTTFALVHQQSSVPTSGTAVVWGLFGKNHAGQHAYQCGSGSGPAFQIRQGLSEPAARTYRAVVGGVAEQEALDANASPEVRRALSRGAVTLTHDPLRTPPGEAIWSEVDVPAGEPVRWRLNVRKVEGKHVAALELVGGAGPAMVWHCPEWHFFASSRFVADSAHAARLLPSVEVRPE
jgi:hypothetical protein